MFKNISDFGGFTPDSLENNWIENRASLNAVKMNKAFDIVDYPIWRGKDNNKTRSVTKMLEDIVKYKREWDSFKSTDRQKFQEKSEDIEAQYLLHTQTGENIGVQTYKDTKIIIEKIVRESTKLPKKRKNEKNFVSNSTKNMKLSEKCLSESPTSEIVGNYFEWKNCSKPEMETRNLYEGWKHLETLIENEICETNSEKEKLNRMLDVNVCIQELHKILTKGLLPRELTPGEFSTNLRGAGSGSETHIYPHFLEAKFAEAAVQSIIDKYHLELDNIKRKIRTGVTKELVEIIFKVAASFLFSFTGIHPFPDGNGRMARLICSYILQLICPFPTPVYNVFSPTKREDYIEAMQKAEKGIKSDIKVNTENEGINIADKYLKAAPADLCSMIIESNWYTWRKLLGLETE